MPMDPGFVVHTQELAAIWMYRTLTMFTEGPAQRIGRTYDIIAFLGLTNM